MFRKHYASSLRIATALLHDEETARDIVHDVFATFLSGSKADITAAYLGMAIRNSCLNYMRDLSVRDRIHNLYLLESDGLDEIGWPGEEILEEIAGVMSKLPSDQCRRVVELRYRDGMKYHDIAETLGISQVAVYKHLRHAMEILRNTLSKK